MKLNFDIKIIPDAKHRYMTAGDYFYKNGEWKIRVSNSLDNDGQFAVIIHEMIELYLTQKHGITEQTIKEYDLKHKDLEEPGDSPNAPYHKEHAFATIIEKLVLKEIQRS